ncbi:MAG: OmpA family protein [Methylophilaceae bacterium]
MIMQKRVIALAISLIIGNAQADAFNNENPIQNTSAADFIHDTGKRIDNGRVEITALPPPTEIQSIAYPLPSGVTSSILQAMKAAAATAPQIQPEITRVLVERPDAAQFESGKADLTAISKSELDDLIKQLAGKPGVRIDIAGHTDNQGLSPNSRAIFGTNQGLSEARALSVGAYLKEKMGLSETQVGIKGFGETKPIAGNNSPAGMSKNRRVEIRVWFDQPILAAPLPTPIRSACETVSTAHSNAPFRISVDGEPLDLNNTPLEADRQRCTDVALEKADIQVRFDNLSTLPQMNAWVTPNGIVRGEKATFRAWANYLPWIKKAEIRLFKPGQQVQETPIEILPVNWNGVTTWQTPLTGPDQVMFLLRVYDAQGHFDESVLKPLTLLVHPPANNDLQPGKEDFIGYGENSLSLRNIAVKGGTVTVNGTHLQPGQRIEAFGLDIPIDSAGKFAMKQIVPSGPNTVEVKMIEPDGESTTFRRNLNIAADDWFYVAMGDLTAGNNHVSGPAQLVTGDKQHYDGNGYVDGRGAFYLKGKVKGEYLLTAAADTREQPLGDLFSNFSSKDPRYLLRNINPDLYYPVYGDDSTTVDDAPTQGKFYVKLARGDSHVMWGNFKTSWSGTELIQYSRGLYGANARYRSESTTTYGEKSTQVDGFAADPGTLGSRDEFRGTGGSLYYLRHQALTMGSERVWVEVRDRDSGLVIERKLLSPAQDYEINYIQGRITLREPLNSTGSASGLISTSSLNGNALYLVSSYEYVPGLTSVENFSVGGRASQWVNDHWQLGITGYKQGEGLNEQKLQGLDTTIRYKPGTYIKLETAKSDGAGDGAQTSLDGGFAFSGLTATGEAAKAFRVEGSVDLAEVTDSAKGKITAYAQERERGFSAPGQITSTGEQVSQQGLKGSVQLTENTQLDAKADVRQSDTMDTQAGEVGIRQKLSPIWLLGVAVRQDNRNVNVANASSLLSQTGDRTDTQIRLDYTPLKEGGQPDEKEDWAAYGYTQGTLARDETRDPNNRAGMGMSWRITDRIKVVAEGSQGNLGPGLKLGTEYRLSDRHSAYSNYIVESERPDSVWRGRQGTLVSGSSYRVSDEMRVFGETRSTNGAGPQSLINAFGLDYAANDYWNFGGKGEMGTVSDPLAGDLDRKAVSISAGYKRDKTKYSGNAEFRDEDSNVAGERKTWLFRNTLGYQATPEWRMLGKLNWSISDNNQGAFYDGDYHEIVTGAAYRPISNDRWNTLFKYTNFYNLPSPGQLAPSGSVADYAQRSQVFSVDTIYDVKPWLSLGGKYAFRIGELKDNKVNGEWFTSRADLWVLRADWHFVKEWDALVEFRNLSATEAKDARAGALLGIYRHMGKGVKAGVGYNFTDYSDDLTNLSYRSRGFFVNVLGTI